MNRTVRNALLTTALAALLTGPSGCGHQHDRAPAAPPVASAPAAAVLSVPSPAPAVGPPRRLVIASIGVDEKLHPVGLKTTGAMATPDFGTAGWYRLGPRPGAPGPAVLVAHVHGPAGDDVFARLHELRPGDRVTVRRTDGTSRFVVDAIERTPKEHLPYERIWADTQAPVLRLITCGGTPDPVTRMYPDNTIVYAHLVP